MVGDMKIDIQLPELPELDAAQMRQVMEIAAEDTEAAIKRHYRKLPEDWFDSEKTNFPDGTPKHGSARTFRRALTQHWQSEDVGPGGFSLAFRATREGGSPWGLRLQEEGGEITPKKARALTIPLTAEARGRRAADFSASVHPLFAVGTKNAQGAKAGTLVWQDDAGELHAAYALRKRVTIKPLIKRRRHHGIPTPWQLGRMAIPAINEAIKEITKNK